MLRQVMEDDLKIFLSESSGVWSADNIQLKEWTENSASIIETYLGVMDEMDKKDDGGTTKVS